MNKASCIVGSVDVGVAGFEPINTPWNASSLSGKKFPVTFELDSLICQHFHSLGFRPILGACQPGAPK